jgi:hypothetical protein
MDREKNIWLANSLIEEARLELIYEKTSSPQGYLRSQLNDFMDSSKDDSRKNNIILEFKYLMPKSGKPFTLEITQAELVENGIVSWVDPKILFSTDYSILKAQLLHQNSHNIRQFLKTLITVLGDNKRVRIFPLLDRDDSNAGYEYLTNPVDYPWKILPDGKSYFDIDLNDENGMYIIQHIVNLLYTGKLAFVVKEPSGTWNDGKMIFAFNREGFLQLDELYSSTMRINTYSTLFREDNYAWRKLWIYPKAWTTGIYAKNNDIRSYLYYIEDSTLDSKHINEFMREYMRRMEILFPRFRNFMRSYLGF